MNSDGTTPELASIPRESPRRCGPVARFERVARVALILTAVFGAGIFLPRMAGADMMQWGFAAGAFSLLLTITAAVTAVIYRRQARELGRLFAGEELLAVWTFTPEHWSRAVQSDWEEEVVLKRRLWYIVLAWCVVIGAGFWIYDPEAGPIVALVLLGVAALCGIAAVAGPRWRRNRQRREAPTAWIGLRGVYCGGLFHDWSLPGSSLQSVQTLEDDCGAKTLELTYRFIAHRGAGHQYETARVPVPPGHEEEALAVAARLAQTIS